MYKKCIICNSLPEELVLNNLPMKKCQQCGLIWRKTFDLPPKHYTEKDRDLSSGKQERRLSNCEDRARTFGEYVDLNSLCDVGCGEGTFLKVLQDMGYKNIMGIEPSKSDKITDFIKENHLNVQRGTIQDVGSIIKRYNIHIITMLHVIEHLENPRESLKIIYDNLTPGSLIIIEIPDMAAYSLRKSNYKHDHLIYPEHLFYFNESNLKTLLEKIGFYIIAKGRRDFNPKNNLTIRESLFRLGLLRKNVYTSGYEPNIKIGSLDFSRSQNLLLSKIKDIIRFILTKIIIILGRQDIMWVIARKL